MRKLSVHVLVCAGCAFVAGPSNASLVSQSDTNETASQRSTASGSVSMDIWDELEEAMMLLCMLIGCTVERSNAEVAAGDVEQQGWTIVLTHTANGLRPDLTPTEEAEGRVAAQTLLTLLAQNPELVSETLRPSLAGTASTIHAELSE